MSQENIMTTELSDQAVVNNLIARFQQTGIEAFSPEDLALCLTIPIFREQFDEKTGMDFKAKYQKFAQQKLNQSKLDISWFNEAENEQYTQFLQLVQKGDIEAVKHFIRTQRDSLYIQAVDKTKKTALHLAAKEGHQALVEFLIQKNFNPNARDKTLKTPLHYACASGHEVIFDILLKQGAQVQYKDKNGATCFHYACASVSAKLVQRLLEIYNEFVHIKDNDERTPIFYTVWNSSQKQIQILRILLENKADINAKDSNKRTPLHHASIGGRSRVIPFLCQKGARVKDRDKDHKYPIDLALNDRIKEMIAVYGNKPQVHSQDEKRDILIQQEEQKKQETMVLKKPIEEDFQIKNQIQLFLRDQFYILMKSIQNQGIQSNQHIKKPYLYTGSWMEGVSTLEDLYERIQDVKHPSEALIRAFNILCPYQDALPKQLGNESTIEQFYGEKWFRQPKDKEKQTTHIEQEGNKVEGLDAYINQIQSLKTEVESQKKQLEIQQNLNDNLMEELKETKQNMEILVKEKNLLEKRHNQLENQHEKLDIQFQDKVQTEINNECTIKDLQTQIKQLTQQQSSMVTIEAYNELLGEKQSIKNQFDEYIQMSIQKNQKNGAIFLKAIQNQKQKQMVAQQDDMYIMADDDAIITLFKKLKNNPPPLRQRLKEVNQDRTGRITQQEFIVFLNKIQTTYSDIQVLFQFQSLCRVFGFFGGTDHMTIDDFIQILDERPRERERQETILFKKLIAEIDAINLEFTQFYELLDLEGGQIITLDLMRETFFEMKINLNVNDFNNLCNVLDKNKAGVVNIKVLQNYLDKFIKKPSQNKEQQVQNQSQLQEEILDFDDFKLLDGDIKLQIPFIHFDKQYKSFFIKIDLKDTQESIIEVQNTEQIRYSLRLMIKNTPIKNLSNFVHISMYEDQEQTKLIGDLFIDWKNCINNSNVWYINQIFELKLVDAVKAKLAVQLKYIHHEQIALDEKKFQIQKSLKGKLVVRLVKGQIHFEANHLTIKTVFQEQQNEFISEQIQNSLAYWNQSPAEYPVEFQEKEYYDKLKIFITQDDLLISKFMIDPSQILYNQEHNIIIPYEFSTEATKNKLYINMLYIPSN